MKIKKSEMIDKYLNLVRDLTKSEKYVTVIQIVVGALGMIPKGLKRRWGNEKLKEKSRLFQPVKNQHHPDPVKNQLKRAWRFERNCCHSISSEINQLEQVWKTHILWNNKYWKCIHHHHHVALVARISLTLSRHSSLSFIALGRFSGQHPVSSHSCWMYVRDGRPAFARPCVGVHERLNVHFVPWLLFFF